MSGEVAVDQGAIRASASSLSGAASGIDATAGGAPRAVDAGEWSGPVNAAIGNLMRAAGAISMGVDAGSRAVVAAAGLVQGADDRAGDAHRSRGGRG